MPYWKEYKLDDLVSKLGDGLHGTPKYDNEGEYYFINGSNLVDGRIAVNENTKRVTVEEFNKYKKDLNDRTIFVSINGTLGNIATYNNEKVILGKSACYFNVKKDVNKEFIKYVVTDKAFQNYISEYATGTTIKNVPLKAIREYPFQLPDLPTQTAIAEILSSLDDKIELNNKINYELEALAQALFKQWFIDFEFPNENGKPYKSSGGEMVKSESGEIPKGWEVSTFKEHLDVERGLSYKGSGLTDAQNGLPMVNLNSVYEGGGYKYEGLKFYSGAFKDRHIIKPWDLAVTNTEQGHKYLLIGYPGVVPKSIGELGIFTHHIYRVRTNSESKLSNQFFNYLMLQPSIREQIIGAANGTTVNMLKIDGLQMPKFVQPSKILCDKFSELIKPIWETNENNHSESQSLTQLRDSLLPKLISGELEVSEALTGKESIGPNHRAAAKMDSQAGIAIIVPKRKKIK